jgi:hypothetical protein
MKTTKLFSALSLALIFTGITAGFSKKAEILSSSNSQSTFITYQVIIHPDFVNIPCNTYLVQITDETGRIVVPPQVFSPGINKYIFKERISSVGIMNSGRAAMLVPVENPKHSNCAYPLVTLPDIKRGAFLTGQTYIFDLYPRTQPGITD